MITRAIFLILLFVSTAYSQTVPPLDIIHFWSTPSEASAINIIADAYNKTGGQWDEKTTYTEGRLRRFLAGQVARGKYPSVFQWHGGSELKSLASDGNLNLFSPDILSGWPSYPKVVKDNIIVDGKICAIPLGFHSENWLWFNKNIYEELNLEIPTEWHEFLKQAEIINNAGYIPLLAGEPWQHQLLLKSILLGILGKENFSAYYLGNKISIIKTPEFLESIDIYLKFRSYMTDNFYALHWMDLTKKLANKDIAAMAMGDWAKVALQSEGLVINKDFVGTVTPQKNDVLLLVLDVLALGTTEDEDIRQQQIILTNIATGKEVQRKFNHLKGSIPVRTDIELDPEKSDEYEMYAYQLLKSDAVIPTNALAEGDLAEFTIKNIILYIKDNPEVTSDQIVDFVMKRIRQRLGTQGK